MFVILLRFSTNKAKAADLMDAHKSWLKAGFEDGVFVLVGGLEPELGGAIFAHNVTRSEIQKRVSADPFVAEQVVEPEIIEISPNKTDQRLQFLNSKP